MSKLKSIALTKASDMATEAMAVDELYAGLSKSINAGGDREWVYGNVLQGGGFVDENFEPNATPIFADETG